MFQGTTSQTQVVRKPIGGWAHFVTCCIQQEAPAGEPLSAGAGRESNCGDFERPPAFRRISAGATAESRLLRHSQNCACHHQDRVLQAMRWVVVARARELCAEIPRRPPPVVLYLWRFPSFSVIRPRSFSLFRPEKLLGSCFRVNATW